jgi:hypothetical protein
VCGTIDLSHLRSPHSNDFGDGLQAPVLGKTIREQMASARIAVTDLLKAVERQVDMANALARLIRNIPEWTYDIKKQGTVPACFELRRSGVRQQILLGELGPSLLPTIFRLVNDQQVGADQFAGAILQLRVEAPHLRGYQASSFQLHHKDIDNSLARMLRPILEGRTRWQGKEHTEIVPGSFIHYAEDCASCGMAFLRITHLVIGNPTHPKSLPPRIMRDDWGWYKLVLTKAETLAKRMDLPIGPFTCEATNRFNTAVPAGQACPKCSLAAPAPLISDAEALRYWPDRDEHFRFQLSMPGKGWGGSTSWVERPEGSTDAWETPLAQKRAERRQELDQRRMQEEIAEAERKRNWRSRGDWRKSGAFSGSLTSRLRRLTTFEGLRKLANELKKNLRQASKLSERSAERCWKRLQKPSS